jgi:hypothetical protein
MKIKLILLAIGLFLMVPILMAQLPSPPQPVGTAEQILYNPNASGMGSTNVQDAIDELEAIAGGGSAHTIKDEDVQLTQRPYLKFTGEGITCSDDNPNTTCDVPATGAGSGHVIEDEGTPLVPRANLNFTGAGVTCSDANPDTICTIPYTELPHTLCASGVVYGGGLDSSTGLYDWGCANYNWSAEVGGTEILSGGDGSTISDYDSATTAGGNSWVMDCLSDGQATGDPVEETVCLNDQDINMYAMADIMLCADNIRGGGKCFLPRGLYHHAYCGQQANGDPNGCPVLQHANDHYQRIIQMWGGRELVGAGQDPDGPHLNGRTGTWIIVATGDDLDGDGSVGDDICDRNGDGNCPNFVAQIRIGGTSGAYKCRRDDGTGGCALQTPATSDPAMKIGRFAKTYVGAILDADIPNNPSTHKRICLDNDNSGEPYTTGTCSGNRDMVCTTSADARTGLESGGCVLNDNGIGGGSVDFGDCEPLVTAMSTEIDAQMAVDTNWPRLEFVIHTASPIIRGLSSNLATSTRLDALASPGAFESDGTLFNPTLETCATEGKWVYLTRPGTSAIYRHPSFIPIWEASEQSSNLWFTDPTKYYNREGGYSHLNIMPGHWLGRNSPNNSADCSAFSCDGLGTCDQDDGDPNSACDAPNPFGIAATWGGHIRHVSTWYGNGEGIGKGVIDTSSGASYFTEIGWSSFNNGYGRGVDASGWWWHDNIWQNWDTGDGTFFNTNFMPGARVERDRYYNVNANIGFKQRLTVGSVFQNIEIAGSQFSTGMFYLDGSRYSLYSGISGYGNRGPIWVVAPENADIWGVTIENINLTAHELYTAGGSDIPEALIVAYDQNGGHTGGYLIDGVTMKHHRYSVSAESPNDICMIFLEGGKGDESSAAHGDGRTIDDSRHQLSFEDIYVERVARDDVANQMEYFCLGNAVSTQNDATEATTLVPGGIWDSRGGMPSWKDLCIDGECMPDNPYRSIRTLDTTLDGVTNIDDLNDEIDWPDHGLRDRDVVTFNEIAGCESIGLTDTNIYYAMYVNKDVIQLDDIRTIAAALPLTDDTGCTFTLTTGREPDCDDIGQGTIIRTHSATAEGNCDDGDADGLLDGGGDYNAVCICGV